VEVASTKDTVKCPYCGVESKKVHSHYKKSFQDLPIQGYKVVVTLNNRKMFCNNPYCSKKTFADTFDFLL
jgi:transposase